MTCKDRLIELIRGAKKNTKGTNCDLEREHLFADYLIENGVIVLPCEVGDIVYQTDGIRIYELTILNILLHRNKPYYETESIDFDEDAIGKSIFLTKEEAEQKLKGGVE